jgi:hypothetical protein
VIEPVAIGSVMLARLDAQALRASVATPARSTMRIDFAAVWTRITHSLSSGAKVCATAEQ